MFQQSLVINQPIVCVGSGVCSFMLLFRCMSVCHHSVCYSLFQQAASNRPKLRKKPRCKCPSTVANKKTERIERIQSAVEQCFTSSIYGGWSNIHLVEIIFWRWVCFFSRKIVYTKSSTGQAKPVWMRDKGRKNRHDFSFPSIFSIYKNSHSIFLPVFPPFVSSKPVHSRTKKYVWRENFSVYFPFRRTHSSSMSWLEFSVQCKWSFCHYTSSHKHNRCDFSANFKRWRWHITTTRHTHTHAHITV